MNFLGSSKNAKEANDSNRVTKMILFNCLLYFFGNILDSVSDLIDLLGIDIYNKITIYILAINIFLFGSHGLSIFIYYHFNKNYRNSFRKIFLAKALNIRSDKETSISLSVIPTSTQNIH